MRILTKHELSEAEQLSRRLHSELRGVIELLPEAERGASAMSRSLEIDRATCQRIVGATARPDATPETLVQLPGVQGLRQFITAVERRPLDQAGAERLAATIAAVDRFESLLIELGGSQRKLKERLDANKPISGDGASAPHGAADDPNAREILFRAAANMTGRWSAATLSVNIIRPMPGDSPMTEGARIHGLVGHCWRDQAVPLEIGQTASLRSSDEGPAFATLDTTPASGSTPGSLLPEFCSTPLPRVISRTVGPRVVHVIDTDDRPDPGSGREPIDIITAHRATNPDRHPATLKPPVGEVWSLQNVATRRLVFDTFLHRDIARRCIPSLELHLWTPDVIRHGSNRWSTRFPGGPRLEVLGPGLRAVQTAAYERYPELLTHVFARLGWDSEEFVGYRCEVTFPVWRAGYCMLFDFSGNEIAPVGGAVGEV